MKRRTLIILIVALVSFAAAFFYVYNAYLYMYFIEPAEIVTDYQLEMKHVAGSTNGEAGFNDGTGLEVLMAKPIRMARLNDSTVVFADINNHAIRTIDDKGNVKTLVGGPDKQGYQDGPADQAKINSPHGVAVRSDGVIAVAEANNNTIRLLTPIQTFDVASAYYEVSTLTGVPGEGGFKDGANAETLFNAPHAVAWGAGGELYVADIGNARIRMVKEGLTTTIAGQDKTGAEDGDLATGTLRYPMDIALDSDNDLWIIDAAELTIRKWNQRDGLSTPFPGLEIAMPHGIAIDEDGEQVIVAEMYGQRITAYDMANGNASVLCGSGTEGNDPTHLRKPAAVLVNNGKIWIADLGNNRITMVDLPK